MQATTGLANFRSTAANLLRRNAQGSGNQELAAIVILTCSEKRRLSMATMASDIRYFMPALDFVEGREACFAYSGKNMLVSAES